MARSHARILTQIWDNDDFLALSSSPQHIYLMLLSQRDLSLCGVINYNPKRLAGVAQDLTPSRVKRSISVLESRRFVIVDRETDELAIRTFVRHDGVLHQPNVLKAASRAWEAIHSREIRAMVFDALPPPVRAIWPKALLKMKAEDLARLVRDYEAANSTPEGIPLTLPGTLEGNPSPEPIGERPGNSLSLSPSPSSPIAPEPFADPPSIDTTSDPPPANPEEEIWTLMARRKAAQREANGDELKGERWIRTVAADYRARLDSRRRLLTGQHPEWTIERLADELDPDTAERDWSQPTAEETDEYLAELDRQAAAAVPMPADMRAELTARLNRSPHRRAANQ